MKKYLSKIIPVLIILWVFLYTPFGMGTGLSADQDNVSATKDETANVGYLENILFEKSSGRERVSLVVSQQPSIAPPSLQADNSLLIKLDNMFAPNSMRETVGEGKLLNVTGVRAQQQTAAGKQWVNLRIKLKENVPYSIRQEGKVVIIDFNIADIEAKLNAAKQKDSAKADEVSAGGADENDQIKKPERRGITKRYTDRIISLDFQDADIKSVLRLMAEYGNASIISGNDVKGNVTLSMKNVPWDQALEAILKINGLAQQQTGDVITVMTLERQKRDEQNKKAAEDEIRKAEDDRKALEKKDQIAKGKLRQILIEAKIVEVTESFIRDLGIQWGIGNNQRVGSSYGLGLSAGTNPFSASTKYTQQYNSKIGYVNSTTGNPLEMAAVNFPTSVVGPTLGLVFGGANAFIETQLAALEQTAQGKVISAPRVVTMDSVKAIIKQGDEVPYITKNQSGASSDVTFKEAMLKLEVTPLITDDGRISMEILASNDTPDYAKAELFDNNPPITKNEVQSKIVVHDGDTVVIGGVFRNQEDKSESGVPFFYKIPVLGWLFKTEGINKTKRQLMIFVTPKILAGSGYIEDECSMDINTFNRCRNRE